jgi:hypothetical protein
VVSARSFPFPLASALVDAICWDRRCGTMLSPSTTDVLSASDRMSPMNWLFLNLGSVPREGLRQAGRPFERAHPAPQNQQVDAVVDPRRSEWGPAELVPSVEALPSNPKGSYPMRLQVRPSVTDRVGPSERNLTVVFPLNCRIGTRLLLLRGVRELDGHPHWGRDKGKSFRSFPPARTSQLVWVSYK